MQIVRYTQEKDQEWDAFIKGSRNGTFLFLRAYMDYHSDRFKDHSLMYYSDKGRLLAVMPANERFEVRGERFEVRGERSEVKALYSHQGLTYGGFILAPKIHIAEIGELFDITQDYLKGKGFSEWHYKQMPSVYHKIPSEEDTYWLWRHNATVKECNMMSAVSLNNDISVISPRKRTYNTKLRRQGFTIDFDTPLSGFWQILEENLIERFNAKPVHSLQEIELLKNRFPKNIVCCTVKNPDGELIAGTLLYITDRVVRTQYISASHEGKMTNALDFLMLSLIEHYSKNSQYRYFEFGTSMDDDEIHLNDGLILQKESLGGRAIACRTYKIKI